MRTCGQSRDVSQGYVSEVNTSLSKKKMFTRPIYAATKNSIISSVADDAINSLRPVNATQSCQTNNFSTAAMSLSLNGGAIVDVCGVALGPSSEGIRMMTPQETSGFSAHMMESNNVSFMRSLSLSSTLRREENVMDSDLLFQLCLQRQLRRHDPVRQLEKKKQDYVYYNHRSKGCYIPRETQKNTITLTYNHMYDFGDGTRFTSGEDVQKRPNKFVMDVLTGKLKALHKISSKKLANNAFLSAEYSIPERRRSYAMRRHQEPTRTISVDLARSLHISELRNKSFQIPIKIEDVIANNPLSVTKVIDGVSSVVGKGKVKWNEVPENLQKALYEEKIRQIAKLETVPPSFFEKSHHGEEATGDLYAVQPCVDETFSLSRSETEKKKTQAEENTYTVAPVQYPTRRQDVAFTDHANQVLLGFTQNVWQPVTNKDGTMSYLYQCNPIHEEETLKGKSHVVNNDEEEEHKSSIKEQSKTLIPSLSKKEETCLLPPVAMASIRDAKRFDSTSFRKTYSGELPQPWTSYIPEKPLLFETSRLHYDRNYDVGDAKPPKEMVHMSTLKSI